MPKWLGLALAVSAAPALSWASDTTPQAGGELHVAIFSQAQCIDPQQDNYGYSTSQGRGLVDSLTDQSYDEPLKIVPWLAKSWEISPDAKEYVFQLRDDVTFSDGTKLDAKVVKDNFDVLAKIPGAAGAAYLTGAQVEAVSDYTLRIRFDAPNVPFLAATSTAELGIVAPATLRQTSDERCNKGVIGSGPFAIESVTYNEGAVFTKRQGYNWASALRKHQGDAYLDKIVYHIVPEVNVRTGVLRSGQVDIVQDLSSDDASNIEKEGFKVEGVEILGFAANLLSNTSRGILADKKVRQALVYGIDRQEVVDLAFNGYKAPATGVLTRRTPHYIDQSETLAYDPDRANALLEEAGWKTGRNGIREKDGQPLTITVSFYSAPVNHAFLEVVQAQLRNIGIDLKLRPLTGGAYDEVLLAGDYDLHRWEWALADVDLLRQILSTKSLNRFRLPENNPIDAPLEAQRATLDPAERQKHVTDVLKTVIEEAYSTPVFAPQTLWASNSKVHGVAFSAGGTDGPSFIAYDAWKSK